MDACVVRRLRVRVGAAKLEVKVAKELGALLQSIADDTHTIDVARRNIADAEADVLQILTRHKLRDYVTDAAEAHIVNPIGRSSTYIDPRTFQDAVSENDFLDTVSVPITSAKKVLSGKEFEKLAVVTVGKTGPDTLQIKVFGVD